MSEIDPLPPPAPTPRKSRVPIFFLGAWFVFQLVAGVGLLGGGSQAGGVAYAAHVGGFIAGLILVKRFGAGGRTRTGGRRR